MKIIRIVSIVVAASIIILSIVFRTLTIYVPVGQVGVRTKQYTLIGEQGVVKEDFGPGWHRDLGPIDSWNLFDATVQTLEMTQDAQYGDQIGRDDIVVKSSDGYRVSVDVTVKYRIKPGQAHKLYQDAGIGDKYKTIVRNQAQDACMVLFGEMATEDFYNPAERKPKAAQVKERLTTVLEDNFVEIIDVLMRNVEFDPEYENKIRRKKLADQEVELNKSLGKAAEMAGKTEFIKAETARKVNVIQQEKESELKVMEAEMDRQIALIKAEAEKYAEERSADADLIAAQKDAEGNLMVKQAEAEGERLRNEAMQGTGGSTMAALEAVRNLQFGEISISTLEEDFLDIDAMTTKFGVPENPDPPQ